MRPSCWSRGVRFLVLLAGLFTLAWGGDQILAAKDKPKKLQKITPAERKAAAKRARLAGVQPGIAALAVEAAAPIPGPEGPGGTPHYFGPFGNWAYSPLPKGSIAAVTLVEGGSGYTSPTVEVKDAYYGTVATPATVTATLGDNGTISSLTVATPGAGYSAPVVIISDPSPDASGALADATIGGPFTGGIRKFVDRLPLLGPAGANNILQTQSHGAGQYIPMAVAESRTFSGQAADYYEIALVEFTEKMHSDLPPTRLRGYVQLDTDGIPGDGVPLTVPGSNPPVPILKPDGTPAVGVDYPHYLGPVIVAQGRAHGVPSPAGDPRPVRIKFYNLLPSGAGGDLFIPVDETVPGSGLGPALPGTAGDKFTQNRATVHLHGNNTVWISDGNTHQWITPANEETPYPKGVSARNVPDMLDADGNVECDPTPAVLNSGCQTFFYTNAQSARLQFYHDHAMGITRLNVYAGEAAGYVLTDAVEQDMIKGTNDTGVNPGLKKVLPDTGIPLVIQDKTWVDRDAVFAQDPTWNWGTGPRDGNGRLTDAVTGDLWFPHVYMSAQNPWDLAGVNAFGRWHYGPWFNPPVPECVNGGPAGCIERGPVPNEYYQPVCDGLPDPVNTTCTAPWEPPFRPGVPNPSIPGEAFMDTPIVNGTAYPYLEVEPRAYRFRILSAANDRFFNLQLYVAADKSSWTPSPDPATPGTPTTLCADNPADRTVCTEVKMVSVAGQPNQYAEWPSGIPDPSTKGPDWILIGTEGGFVPEPVVVPQQPVGWNLNPTTFNFGVVNQHSLLLGSAERADVVVDFSAYAGKTLILYNDAPAAFPAGVPTYDYYTGVENQMASGGAPTTLPGYGPNTRTIMQIRVAAGGQTPPAAYSLQDLKAVFAKGPGTKRGVFELTQDPIIIPQQAYNSAYDASFTSTASGQYIQIADTQKTFQPINEQGVLQPAVTLPLEMKAMHDEMGGVYDTMFGRMSGMLGLTNPLSPVNFLIPYGYSSPPTDLVKGSFESTPIGVMPDGTQLWRIFHNGVDTHTIHTHLFHAQLVNRLGQDGQQLGVDPIELGWKDTFRVNPLEITYFALRPTVPTQSQLPFEVPDSVRLIDPSLPEGANLPPPPPAGWFDPQGNPIPELFNHTVNFGWEYVWHCHILAHEEMDMMHSLVFAVPPKAPTLNTPALTFQGSKPQVVLNWTDNSFKEIQFTVERATNTAFSSGRTTFNVVNPVATVPSLVTFTDTTVANNITYYYRVWANGGTVGDVQTAGFPTLAADAVSTTQSIRVGAAATTPAAPSNIAAVAQAGPRVSLTFRDNANNESGFLVERCTVVPPATTCTSFALISTPGPRSNTGNVTYLDTTVVFGTAYLYRVAAVNDTLQSAYATLASPVTVPAIPAAPPAFTVAVAKANGNNYTATLNWTASANPTNFTIQRATNLAFTAGLSTSTVAGTLRTATQSVNRNTTYYFRIRSNNSIGGSSAWTNALPFPIRTGN